MNVLFTNKQFYQTDNSIVGENETFFERVVDLDDTRIDDFCCRTGDTERVLLIG